MRKAQKFLSVLLAAAMLLGASLTAAADEPGEYEGKIVLLHSNDTHGAAAFGESCVGFDGAAAIRARYEAGGAGVLLLDAGDFSQGQPIIDLYDGLTALEFMNAAGYDAAAIGNHEFDHSFDTLLKMLNSAEFPLLSANITYKDTGDLVFEAHRVFELDGAKIGVFGLATPGTMTSASPANTANISFGRDADELCAIAAEQVAQLESAGCDLIACLGHLGDDSSAAPYRSLDVIENVSGIDLFIDGHSHSSYESGQMVGDTLLVSAGERFEFLGAVVYDPADGSLSASLLTADDVGQPDKAVTAIIEAYAGEVEADYGAVFAKTEVDLDGERDTNRTGETNLGDLTSDAVLWQARRSFGEVDAAINNGGAIRAGIPAGDITKNDLVTVFPYGNTISILKLTGAQLLEAIEAATWCTPISAGSFPQVAGIELRLNTSVDYAPGALYPDSTYYAPAEPGSRVTIRTVGGEAFDPEAVYTIATNDFLAIGGDTYYVFTQASYSCDTGVALEEALISYISEELGGVVGSEYAEPQGRIRVSDGVLDEFTDLAPGAWYEQSVSYAVENGYIVGVGGGLFQPDAEMTRAQYMTLLYRVGEKFGIYPDAETTGENWYVPGAALANDYAFSWTEEELMKPITRYELTIASARLLADMYDNASLEAQRESAGFSDVPEEAAELIDELYRAGLINGYEDGTFRPDGTAKRCEIAQIVYNMLEVVQPVAGSAAAAA